MSLEKAAADIARSGLSPQQVSASGISYTPNAAWLDRSFAPVPALDIVYHDLQTGEPLLWGSPPRVFRRVRYLEPVTNRDGKLLRYTQPAGSPVEIYFPFVPGIWWPEIAKRPDIPVVITEGEKKALSACLRGINCIGLGGVWNWRSGDKTMHPNLMAFHWQGRRVVIAYDSDAVTNPQVRFAELALAGALQALGADVRIARLFPAETGEKRGVDDYIAGGDVQGLLSALDRARIPDTIEKAIMQMNAEVAFLESEDRIFIPSEDRSISKNTFVNGGRWAPLTVEVDVPAKKGKDGKVTEATTKKIRLAPAWLMHPGARRYSGTIFRPDTLARDIPTPNGLMLNRWQGLTGREGDVTPFLELTQHLLSKTPPEVAEVVVKLLAYKAQNPAEKPPLAIILIGPQGCGKSAWGKLLSKAFAPYGVAVPSKALKSDFMEWLETSLFVLIDEAQAADTREARDTIKNLVSEQQQRINMKHVQAKQADTYNLLVMTSNKRGVGAWDHDDRRMIVIDCPGKREPEFYDRLHAWASDGGPAALMHWLQTYDLQGWVPPKVAPSTAEKKMARQESLTPVERLAFEMESADQNVVGMWVSQMLTWARAAETSANLHEARRAKEVLSFANGITVRPWYTPEELAAMFPSISIQLHGSRKLDATPAGEISRQLRDAGVPYLVCADNDEGFRWHGRTHQFLVIADREQWAQPITQAQFEMWMRNWPGYATWASAQTLQRTG